jgi:hypothetical protein
VSSRTPRGPHIDVQRLDPHAADAGRPLPVGRQQVGQDLGADLVDLVFMEAMLEIQHVVVPVQVAAQRPPEIGEPLCGDTHGVLDPTGVGDKHHEVGRRPRGRHREGDLHLGGAHVDDADRLRVDQILLGATQMAGYRMWGRCRATSG